MVSIWNLPLDILQRIFIHCCTNLDKRTGTQACTYNLVVTGASIVLPCQNTLRHVSHQWRFVVEYSAVLWSNIHIIWPCEYRHAGLRVEILRYFVHYAILRSQTNDLDIYIEDEGWEETARLLLPQSHRWRSLVFAKSAITVPTAADFRAMRCKIPRLQKFRFPVWTPDLDYDAFQKAFVDAPTLRTFECNLAMLTWGLRFPWTQIVNLSLVYSGSRLPGVGDKTFNKVMQSSNLRRLTISGLLPDTTGRDASTIAVPHLQELSANTPNWIPLFVLPALKTNRRRFGGSVQGSSPAGVWGPNTQYFRSKREYAESPSRSVATTAQRENHASSRGAGPRSGRLLSDRC
ncbi:hypothetical protein CYLTODRAFT_444905 [Cylindrobasidium torrendii FP15055 ss-10]|uniref:F-box domain-containing protein n=1 Tax=Cylindrobasidium torrendii FP15055 ss-10 TaxID=1314674 RepID=A0A0D7B6B4_9AGAR|nr:hypothetical protein CYLTODRAFT_444905 [Cylindrobasidium torrendii FP15055 ss-10]